MSKKPTPPIPRGDRTEPMHVSGPLRNGRWERFAQLMAPGNLSKTDCYAQAGFEVVAKEHRKIAAYKLSREPAVSSRIVELRQMGAERSILNVERVLEEASHIALSDIRKVMSWKHEDATDEDPKGKVCIVVVDSEDLPDDVARAIHSVHQTYDGGPVSVKLHSKEAALRMLLAFFKGKGDTPAERGDERRDPDHSEHPISLEEVLRNYRPQGDAS